jgi:serine/threonine protein kinase
VGCRCGFVYSSLWETTFPIEIQSVGTDIQCFHLSCDLCDRDILEKSARGDYSLEGKEWDGISAEAKDLVRRMLTVDPEKRITTGGTPLLTSPMIANFLSRNIGSPLDLYGQ